MARRMPDALKANRIGSLRLALACAVVVVFTAGAPLHAQSYQDLYNFNCPSGCSPFGRLTQGTDGNLYGTTVSGGANNFGTLFLVNPAGTGYTDLYPFDSSTGAPNGGLTLSSVDGNFYGTTAIATGGGTLYRFSSSTMTLTVLHPFNSSMEGTPQGPPVEDKHKNLYGLTTLGADPGRAYSLTVATETYALLPHSVPPYPSGPLVLAADGNLYGTTASGGSSDEGTVFGMTSAGAVKILYPFTGGSDGGIANAPLVQGKDGNLYGTTFSGGGGVGVVFKVTLPPPSSETPLIEFDGSDNGGANPQAGLLAASDGNFYGPTWFGGVDNLGTLFEMTSGPSYTYIPLFDLSGNVGTTSGAYPTTTLMEDTNGLFYGLTLAGGTNGSGDGVFYTLTPANPVTHISPCCNWWVILDQPVTIIGQNLTGVISVDFGSVSAKFRPGSDTYLTASVPSAAIDSLITVTLATGEQIESQQEARILPKITNLDPSSGPVGTQVGIVGGGFARTTKVTFGGVATGNFTVVNPALIQATVPAGAVTGKVGVVTPNGSAISKETFTVN
jgi:uncharacterized repeat protein (TIGR03803 family)